MTVPGDLKLFIMVGILARFPSWALRIPLSSLLRFRLGLLE
jgi:hypothetical protein